MKLEIRQSQGVTIIAPSGKITIGKGDIALRDSVIEALQASSGNILLDLGAVTTIDSSGIGELVSSYTTVTNQGRKLALLQLPPKVSDLLQITQLITVFDTYKDEAEALEAIG